MRVSAPELPPGAWGCAELDSALISGLENLDYLALPPLAVGFGFGASGIAPPNLGGVACCQVRCVY